MTSCNSVRVRTSLHIYCLHSDLLGVVTDTRTKLCAVRPARRIAAVRQLTEFIYQSTSVILALHMITRMAMLSWYAIEETLFYPIQMPT